MFQRQKKSVRKSNYWIYFDAILLRSSIYTGFSSLVVTSQITLPWLHRIYEIQFSSNSFFFSFAVVLYIMNTIFENENVCPNSKCVHLQSSFRFLLAMPKMVKNHNCIHTILFFSHIKNGLTQPWPVAYLLITTKLKQT